MPFIPSIHLASSVLGEADFDQWRSGIELVPFDTGYSFLLPFNVSYTNVDNIKLHPFPHINVKSNIGRAS